MSTVIEELDEVGRLIRSGRPTPAEHLILALIGRAEPEQMLRCLLQYRATIKLFFVPHQRLTVTQALENRLPGGWQQAEKVQIEQLQLATQVPPSPTPVEQVPDQASAPTQLAARFKAVSMSRRARRRAKKSKGIKKAPKLHKPKRISKVSTPLPNTEGSNNQGKKRKKKKKRSPSRKELNTVRIEVSPIRRGMAAPLPCAPDAAEGDWWRIHGE